MTVMPSQYEKFLNSFLAIFFYFVPLLKTSVIYIPGFLCIYRYPKLVSKPIYWHFSYQLASENSILLNFRVLKIVAINITGIPSEMQNFLNRRSNFFSVSVRDFDCPCTMRELWPDFDVLLTVHLSIILVIDQLNAQILFL